MLSANEFLFLFAAGLFEPTIFGVVAVVSSFLSSASPPMLAVIAPE